MPIYCHYLWRKVGCWVGNRSSDNEWEFWSKYSVTQNYCIWFLHWSAWGCWIYKKHSTKCETVTKIPDTQVARLSSKDHVSYYGNMWVPWMWPNVPGGRLHRCIVSEIWMMSEMVPVRSKSRWTTLNIFKKLYNCELDLRFSRLWQQMLLCCGMWYCVVQLICSKPSHHVGRV